MRLPKGTAGQVLQMNSGATAPEWATGGLSETSPAATTSGTTVTIDDVLDGAKRYTVNFWAVGATSDLRVRVRLRVGGTTISTNYTSTTTLLTNSSQSGASFTDGFGFNAGGSGSDKISGILTITKNSTGDFIASGVLSNDVGNTIHCGGRITSSDVGGTVTGLAIVSVNGTFDSGNVWVFSEP
ncbi:MAG: hypothetical protein HC889_18800 [Synechococcaceae cyanobacterium SM1_2_3]|nr:hypothetical protein [Synechococcaceae cyanobacterium SM1_2_3]